MVQHCKGTSRCWFGHRRSWASCGLHQCQHSKHDDGSYEFTQHALIYSNVEDIGLSHAKTTIKPIPVAVQKPLQAFKDSPYFNNHFNYHSVVGKLSYIAQTMHQDIIYAMHQCAHFSSYPLLEHGEAIVYLVWHLLKTHHYTLLCHPL